MNIQKTRVVTGLFTVIDSHGMLYTIQEITTETIVTDFRGHLSTFASSKEYRLINGDHVNKISDGLFELVFIGEVVNCI